LTYAEKY
jgi:hypothetical protein